MCSLIFFAAATDSAEAGQLAGKVLAVVACAAGAIKCFSISRRPTTNSKCVLSLMLLLVGWSLASLVALLRDARALPPALGLSTGLFTFTLFIVSIVLGILGLIEYAQKREAYTQGRAQALWSLGLCALFMVMIAIGIGKGTSGGVSRSRNQPSAGQALKFPELNFQFLAPGQPWVQFDAPKLNPASKLGFLRSGPNVQFIIIAEELGQSRVNNETLAEAVVAHLRSASDAAQIGARERAPVGRLEGLRWFSDTERGQFKFAYCHWVCATNGWAYQLVCWCPLAEKSQLAAPARQMTEAFALLDYDRRASAFGSAPKSDFVSTNFQFRVRCAGSDWRQWSALEKEAPSAAFGALYFDEGALVVSAAFLRDLAPTPEAIYHGFGSLLGATFDDSKTDKRREITHGEFRGIESQVKLTSTRNEDFTYRIRILHGGGVAYLVAAWAKIADPRREQILTDGLMRVELPEKPPSVVPPELLTEAEKRGHRLFFNQVGLFYFNAGQFESSARFFKAALNLEGERTDTPYLGNLVQAWTRAGKYREALEVLEENPSLVAARAELQANSAFLQGETGQLERALTNYAMLFAGGFRDESHFKEYIGLLSLSDQPERALREVETFLQARDTAEVRLLQANLLKRQKKYDQAIALLQTQRQKNAFHSGVARALVDAFIQAQRHSDALALSEELLKNQGDDASWLFLKGRAEFGLKWYRQAKESFERAARKAPNDPDIQSFLNHTSGLLGEGANSALKEFIEPVPVPAALLEPVSPVSPDYAQDDGAYYERRLTAISFVKGKELKTTDYITVRTLNAAGVSAFSTFQIALNSLNESLFINRLEVKAPDGSLVSTGRVSDFYLLDDSTSEIASYRKVVNLPLSGLQPGYSVELVATRRELGPLTNFPFLAHTFSSPFLTREAVLFLRGDTGAVRYAASPPLEPERLADGLCWRSQEPPVFHREPMQATPVDYLATVWLGDNSARWASEAINYLVTIRERMELPASQRELARDLTAGATNDLQKISAICGHIQTNFTYKAIEFGRRARMPQKTADIVRNKYGDCKDHALLAQQMLASVGVPASLALVSFNGALRHDLPSVDQFDHMIVHVAGPDGGRFLDCTDKMSRPALPVPFGLAGRDALILDEKNPRFVRLGEYPADASVIRSIRSVQVTNRTDALVEEKLTLEGIHGALLRGYLRHQPASLRRSYVAGLLKQQGAELIGLTFDGLEQPHLSLVLNLVYAVRSRFHETESQLIGQSLGCFEQTYLAAESVEKRLTPFQIATPLTLEGSVTIRAPEGFRANSAAAPIGQKWDDRFLRGRLDVLAEKSVWRLSYTLHEPAGRFAPGDYDAFCATLGRASRALSPKLTFERVRP